VSKLLFTLKKSNDRGCNARVEPHIANKNHLSKNISNRPGSLSGHCDHALGVDLGANCLLDLVGSSDQDHYSGLVPFLGTTGLCRTGRECILGPDVLQVLGVGIVDGRLGTVEFDLLMNSSPLKVTVRGSNRLLPGRRNIREGSREHVRPGRVRLRV